MQCPHCGYDHSPGERCHMTSGTRQVTESALNKAADALHLLGLIERHGWTVVKFADGSWHANVPGVHALSGHQAHFAPTLIEALAEAANCDRCCGRES